VIGPSGRRPRDWSPAPRIDYNTFNVASSRPNLCPSWICTAVCALAAVPAFAQGSATLQGTVRDSRGRPLGAAIVYLKMKATGQTLTAHTDPAGSYRFTGLYAGTYLLRAEGAAAGEAAARPLILGERETKDVDLTVEYVFFDEPSFIVAGVTDPISRGGHGSDTVLRSTEALAKATAALSEETPGKEPGSASASYAELHHKLGYAAERRGDALEAVREYQRAAELEASEPNLFDWGAELLMHRAAEPATEVFAKGRRLFPHSLRMMLGLAAAWYARGEYDEASRRFFEACDLNPGDPGPYMFLGKVRSVEITKLDGYVDRLERFAKLRPDNAWANYYYAAGLWKQRKGPEDSETPARVRELLEKAVRLDPSLGAAYLQLGIVYSDQNDDAKAIAAYQQAIEVSPRMDEAHYRLGQAYQRTGQKEKARRELETYERTSEQLQQEIERQRSEIQQFVFELRHGSPAAPR
jgi:tetratricopeptide (TPR) repeat protein